MLAAVHSIKPVGANGQISLGKQYAGQYVLTEEREPGVWLVRLADVIPRNERWLHAPEMKASLQAAMAWAGETQPSTADLDVLGAQLAAK
jgi:hypothetical protein